MMGRPPKTGLSYFSKYVTFYNDFQIMDLLEDKGPAGVTVYDVILCLIYQNGYYLAEPLDKVASVVVRIIGGKWVKKDFVLQVILTCGDLGLFEKCLLPEGVITSAEIQRQYAIATVRNKAKKDRYWLIGEEGQPLLNAPISGVSATESQVSATESPVSEAKTTREEKKERKSYSKREKEPTQEEYETLVRDYGKETVDRYVKRTREYHCCYAWKIREWIEQDRKKKPPSSKPNQFTEFPQRDYASGSITDLERRILENRGKKDPPQNKENGDGTT